MIGQIVNYRYEVLEKIGDGELFSVYKSRDKVLNRLVALKVLSKDLSTDREFASSLVEGYQAASSLTHTSIAKILDADCTAESCFVATEYVRGINVKERVRRAGPMAVPNALDVIIPVLEALEYAHANRIYHGDLRPQDIIVSPDGEVKVTDFGLSWALDRCPAAAERFPMRSIHYQAPEISEGAAPSAASDVYSVGVILYEMLTSTLPYDGATSVSIALKKVKESPVAPRQINAGVPKSLNDIIMRAIEVAPENRYQNVAQMQADLRIIRDALRTGQPASVPPATTTEEKEPEAVAVEPYPSVAKTYLLLTGVFLLVVLLVGAVTWYVIRPTGEIEVPRLLGKTWADAVDIAKAHKIELVDDGRVSNDMYEADTICLVTPPEGTSIPRNDAVVRVKISSGPSEVAVPKLTGMTEADATEAATHEGFVIGKITPQYSDKVDPNVVISQDPGPGTRRPPGSTVDVVLSQGPKPETQEQSEEQPAGGELQQRRFNVAVEVPEDAQGAQDVVIKVDDKQGETTAYEAMHDPGDKFTVTVSTTGPSARIRIYVGGSLVSDARY